jgi:hypothetical protein
MSRFKLIALVILAAFQVRPLHATAALEVGSCFEGGYPTISAAVAAAPPGATIKICPGTYPEQIVISEPLTLQGFKFNNKDEVIVTVPSSGLSVNGFSALAGPVAAQILVTAGPVTLSNLVVDGSNSNFPCDSNQWQAGIYLESASGTVKDVEAQNQVPNFIRNCGVGLWAENNSTLPISETFSNNTVHDVNAFGVITSTSGSSSGLMTATVSSSSVDTYGAGSTGIYAYGNTASTISNNNVDLYGIGSVGIQQQSLNVKSAVSTNSVQGAQTGILAQAPDGIVSSNQLFGNSLYSVVIGAAGITLSSNTIVNSGSAGINLGCYSTTLKSNTVNGAPNGTINQIFTTVPAGNNFFNVPALLGAGCQ